jgi:hypothetical protein
MKYLISSLKHVLSSIFIELKVIYWGIVSTDWINLSIIEGQKFRFKREGAITKILFYNQHLVSRKKSFEYETLSRFYNEIQNDYTVLDIGGNIGLFILLASRK